MIYYFWSTILRNIPIRNIPMRNILFFSLLVLLSVSCKSQDEINNIVDVPAVVDADHSFADVYKPLDGTWKGTFLVKQDQHPDKRPDNMQEVAVMMKYIEQAKTVNTIQVTQTYTSESPYFQRVAITDYYPDSGKTEESVGVNKVQNGEMWCVVHKPNDVVIHEGSTPNDETIIWQSSQQSPLKVEYFYETVTPQSYEIVGYGYYGNDDTAKSPKLWFYGKYMRQ